MLENSLDFSKFSPTCTIINIDSIGYTKIKETYKSVAWNSIGPQTCIKHAYLCNVYSSHILGVDLGKSPVDQDPLSFGITSKLLQRTKNVKCMCI